MKSTDRKLYLTSLPPPYFTSSRPQFGLSLSSLLKPPSWVVCTLLGKCLFYTKNTFIYSQHHPKKRLTLSNIDRTRNSYFIGTRKAFLRSRNEPTFSSSVERDGSTCSARRCRMNMKKKILVMV